MLASFRCLLLATLASWCIACGGKSNADQRDAIAGNGSQGGSGGSAQGGKASGGNASSGTSMGGSVAEPECEALIDDEGYFVPVSIINDSSETLFVGHEQSTCGAMPWFDVTDADGRPLSPPGPCRTSCASAMSEAGPASCPPVCLLPTAVELAPGNLLSTQWAGRYIELVALPESCQSAQFPTPQCDRAVAVQPGELVFSAKAGTKLDCQLGGECLPCQPDERGACVTPSALITGAIRQAETKVELDASYGLGAGNGDGAIQFVEIRFRDP
jgi:hypothetical protein